MATLCIIRLVWWAFGFAIAITMSAQLTHRWQLQSEKRDGWIGCWFFARNGHIYVLWVSFTGIGCINRSAGRKLFNGVWKIQKWSPSKHWLQKTDVLLSVSELPINWSRFGTINFSPDGYTWVKIKHDSRTLDSCGGGFRCLVSFSFYLFPPTISDAIYIYRISSQPRIITKIDFFSIIRFIKQEIRRSCNLISELILPVSFLSALERFIRETEWSVIALLITTNLRNPNWIGYQKCTLRRCVVNVEEITDPGFSRILRLLTNIFTCTQSLAPLQMQPHEAHCYQFHQPDVRSCSSRLALVRR